MGTEAHALGELVCETSLLGLRGVDVNLNLNVPTSRLQTNLIDHEVAGVAQAGVCSQISSRTPHTRRV